jgi:hypothetical protein
MRSPLHRALPSASLTSIVKLLGVIPDSSDVELYKPIDSETFEAYEQIDAKFHDKLGLLPSPALSVFMSLGFLLLNVSFSALAHVYLIFP